MSATSVLPVAAGISIMVAALVMAARSYRRQSPPSSAAGYHSRKAAMVMLVGSESIAILMFVVSDNGPAFGLHTPGAELAVLIAACVLVWIAYQAARKRWPAGSD